MEIKKILFVGIDASLQSNQICALDPLGQIIIRPFKVSNNFEGAHTLVVRLEETLKKQQFEGISLATEATGHYDWHLLEFLALSEVLEPFKPTLYRLNAKLVHNFKKSIKDLPKTDPSDAYAIAERIRTGHLPASYCSETLYLPLRRLTRFRFHLAQTMTAEKNHCLNFLFLKFSSLCQNKVFSNTWGATSQAVLLDFFSVEEIVAMPIEQLVEFLIKHSKNHFADPQAIASILQKTARESYRLRPELKPSINFLLACSSNNIAYLSKTIDQMDQAISREIKGFAHTLQSIPGIGPVLAAGILAEIGSIHRFSSEAKLAHYAGLTWKKNQSGDFDAEETPLTKAGNQYLRYYLVEAANLVRCHDPQYRAFYQRKYQEASKHKHHRALVLTARKLVRLIFSMLQKGQLYQPGGHQVQIKDNN